MESTSIPRLESDRRLLSASDQLENLPTVLLALQQGFTEFYELVRADVARQRRLVRIDDGLNHRGAVVSERSAQGPAFFVTSGVTFTPRNPLDI